MSKRASDVPLLVFILFALGLSHLTCCLESNRNDTKALNCIPLDATVNCTDSMILPAERHGCLQIVNIPLNVRFLLIEAHSQKHNITLSEINTPNSTRYAVTGTAVGMVSMMDSWKTTTYWLFNQNNEAVKVVLSIVPYFEEEDPIPGGCNMEFPVEISPFLRLQPNHGYVNVEFQSANAGYPSGATPPLCSDTVNSLTYDIYLYFLDENTFDELFYFNGISAMRDVASIKQNGKLVKPYFTVPKTRATFISYPGQGVIYNVVASYQKDGKTYESAYVPIATYGCSFVSEIDGCGHLSTSLAKFFAIASALIGLLVATRGHRYLTIEMAYFGFLVFALIAFIVLTRSGSYKIGDRDILTMLSGAAGALIWAGVWWFFGIPIISVLLVGFVLGFLLTSILFYTPIGNTELLRSDLNYWMLLSCGMLVTPVALLPTTKFLNILSSSVVGSYAVVVAIDRYIGSTLSYIVLNVVKRAVVKDFYLASNEVPFQFNDIMLCSTWFVLCVLMVAFQLYMEKGRAPFPPAPLLQKRRDLILRRERRVARMSSNDTSRNNSITSCDGGDERTPLLPSAQVRVYT